MKRLIVANWKMNPKTAKQAVALARGVEGRLKSNKVEVVIAPPFPFVAGVRKALRKAKLGAQDVSDKEQGAYTGEVSAKELKSFGVKYAIVGHSERRGMGESDKLINRKLRACLAASVTPILCVGFGTKKNMSEVQVRRIIQRQLRADLKNIKGKVIVAYEPVWAISTGYGKAKQVEPEHAAAVIKFIRSKVRRARVLYGGSITSKNAASFAQSKGIDGGLIGGASLKAGEFLKIIKAFEK